MTQMGPSRTSMCSSLFSVISVDAGIFVKGKTLMNSKLLNTTGMYNPRNVMKTSTMVAQRSREDNSVNGAHPTDLHIFSFYVGIFQFLGNVWFDSCDFFSSNTIVHHLHLWYSGQHKKTKAEIHGVFWEIKPFVFSKTCIFFKRLMHFFFFLVRSPTMYATENWSLEYVPHLEKLSTTSSLTLLACNPHVTQSLEI